VTVITDSVGGDLTWDAAARAVLGKGLDLNVDARTCHVPRSTLSGKTYSLAGTFAAPWCGMTRG
jgi:hypothetical protein